MKKVILLLLVLSITFSASALAWHRDFGLGVIVGDPTGLSFKLWQSKNTAIDAAVGWWLGSYIDMHIDYLIHNFKIIKLREGSMPLYFGIGAFGGASGSSGDLGVRVPFGMSYLFSDAPIDIFLEVAPSLNVLPGMWFTLQWGLGARFYFQ